MTEMQRTNIAVANFIIDELHKDKPFNLVLDFGQTVALHHIAAEAAKLNSCWHWLYRATEQHKNSGTAIVIDITKTNADLIYHMLSSYVAKHDQYGVVRSLGEVP